MAKVAVTKICKRLEKSILALAEEFDQGKPSVEEIKVYAKLVNSYSKLVRIKHETRKKDSDGR